MSNFTDVLNLNLDDIQKPAVLPAGTYLALCEGEPQRKTVGKEDRPVASIRVKIIAPGDDIHPGDLAELPDGVNGRVLFYTLWLSGDDMAKVKWDIKNTLQNIGVDTEGKSGAQALAEVAGKQCYVTVTRRVNRETGEFVNDIRSFARL